MFKFFKKRKKEPQNLKEVLVYLKNLEKNFENLSRDLENLKKESKFSLQKVGIVRFNPFSEVGGDQSFSIALLNSNDDGLVITSLYSREENRVYGKPIKGGESVYHLSKEEKEAIKKARRRQSDYDASATKTQDENKKAKKSNNSSTNSSGLGTY